MSEKTRSIKIADDTHRRISRIALREQRTLTAVLDRAVLLYDQEARRAQAARRKGETT